jgi:hypothetical protein
MALRCTKHVDKHNLVKALEAVAKIIDRDDDDDRYRAEIVELLAKIQSLFGSRVDYDLVDEAYSLIIHSVISTRMELNNNA